MIRFEHNYPYDPCYGYSLEGLLKVKPPLAKNDFVAFWQQRYAKAMQHKPVYQERHTGSQSDYAIYDISYTSTDEVTINGWLLVPEHEPVKSGIIIGHGYGGRDKPDYHLLMPNTAFLFPCFRGLGLSRCARFPEQPDKHIIQGIENRDDYILGGCVDDLWLGVTVLLEKFPQVTNKIGYMGISFGGGIGCLAMPWDERIKCAHFNVPTFGNNPLRLSLPTIGSADAVKKYFLKHHSTFETLAYYDAAIAAGFSKQAAYFALGLFDPVVAPPGQFSIYNSWMGEKHLFILDAGHFDYPNQSIQEQQLIAELKHFFGERLQ